MTYERSKRAHSSPAAPSGSDTTSTSTGTGTGRSPIVLQDEVAQQHKHHTAVRLDMAHQDLANGGSSTASSSISPGSASIIKAPAGTKAAWWVEAGPVFAAHGLLRIPKVLVLAFFLPLLVEDGRLRHSPPGLQHGALAATDALSAAYLAYVVLTFLLAPLVGALADASSPQQRRGLLLVVLTGPCLVPLALVVLLHLPSSSYSWPAVAGILASGVVLSELAGPLLTAELISGLAPGATSIEAGLLANQAALVGLGLATLLVGVPALIAAAAVPGGHDAALEAARYSGIGGLALSVLCFGYAALSLLLWRGPDARAAAAAATQADKAQAPGLPPRRSLLARSLYQAGLRSSGYLGVAFILRQLGLRPRVASTALVLALLSSLFGGLLSHAFLAAYEKRQRRQQLETRTRARRASSVLVTSGSGAGIAAARLVGQQQQQQQRQEQQSSPPPPSPPAAAAAPPVSQAPLLVVLALLTLIFAAVPSEVKLDPRTGTSELARSKEGGVVYVIALLVGLGLGFLQGYERGVLASLGRPQGGNGGAVGPGQLKGILVSTAAVLEWAPTLLYAGLAQRHVEAPLRALAPCFGLALLAAVLGMAWDRLGLGLGGGEAAQLCSCSWGQRKRTGDRAAEEPPAGERPRLGGRGIRQNTLSFFLLRALPSHLSTILESPATSAVAPVSPTASSIHSGAGAVGAGEAPSASSRPPSVDWTTRT